MFVLIVTLMALLCVQTEARRFLLGEVNKEKSSGVVNGAGAVNVKAKNEPGKAVIGSVEPSEAEGENTGSSTSTDSKNGQDDKNDSYGNYGNPSDSTTETQHVYTRDCPPQKSC